MLKLFMKDTDDGKAKQPERQRAGTLGMKRSREDVTMIKAPGMTKAAAVEPCWSLPHAGTTLRFPSSHSSNYTFQLWR